MRRVPLALLIVLWAVPAWGATYTVKKAAGDYATIQTCADAAQAGDTCTVYAGTYDEYVTLPRDGSDGHIITFTVHPGDAVVVRGFSIRSYTTINGFDITDPAFASSYCVSVPASATRFTISYNTIHECGTGQAIRTPLAATTTYGVIRGNTISWPAAHPAPPCASSCGGGAAGMLINGDYHLIEQNDISHVTDFISLFGAHNVVRNNTLHDVSVADFPSTGDSLHVDGIESQCSQGYTSPLTYALVEGNLLTNNTVPNGHAWLFQDSCTGTPSQYAIVRYNTVYNLGSYYLLDNLGAFEHVKDYHNTVSTALTTLGQWEAALNFYDGSNNGAAINNLWYNIGYANGGAWGTNTTGFVAANNLSYFTTCGTECTYADPFNTSTGAIKNLNPLLTNPASDWTLQAGSPAIAAGAALTTVAVADTGSGTDLIVGDAGFFQDGKGIVTADVIRVGATTTAMIASINYATNTLTLASGISRSDGDAVYLAKKSDGVTVLSTGSPDIGAWPSSRATPSAPTSVRIK